MSARHKFSSKLAERDGMTFHSKLEARYYDHLILLKKLGDVAFFLRQVPIHLPGNVKYVVDFQVFYTDGTIEFVDPKGVETDAFIKNKKLVEALYPFKIKVVKKGQF